jgi:hypothetical protein
MLIDDGSYAPVMVLLVIMLLACLAAILVGYLEERER